MLGMEGSGESAGERSLAAANALSPRFLDRAHELVAIGTFVIDLPSQTIRLSSRMAQLLGVSDGAFKMSLAEYRQRFYLPEDLPARQATAEQHYATGKPLLVETRVRRADGSLIWVRASSSTEQDEHGRPCIVGVIQDITAQKETELELRNRDSQLRENEELFRATFEHAQVGVSLVSTKGRFLRVNAALCRMLGYSAEELTQLSFNDVTHPEDAQVGSDTVLRALAGGPTHAEFDKRYMHKSGEVVWVHVAAALVATDLGHRRFFVAHIEDVSRLRRSEERFRKLFATVPAALSVSRAVDGCFVDANAEFERVFGWSKAELVGRTSVEMGMWGDARARTESLRISLGNDLDQIRNLVLRRRDGSDRTLRSAAQLVEVDGEQLLVSAFLDVTEQLHAEQERLHAEQRYRELVDGVRDVVFALDPNGVITSLNPAFERITGMPRADWIGRRFEELIHPDDLERGRRELVGAITEAPQDTPPLRLMRTDGSYWLGEINVERRFEQEQLTSLLGIGRDISERVNLEERLRQAQKMEAIGVLAGGVAHDFNNILGVILGYTALLLPKVETDDPRRAQLLEIQASTERAVALTRQLMAFSRRQVLQPKVVDLNDVVISISSMLRRMLGDDVRLIVVPLIERGWVFADPGQLEQVLMNLAVNARDAMPRGGAITLEIRRIELEGAQAAALSLARGSYLRLGVSDTGEGMDKATQGRIFEPFFTTKAVGKGTGLGLATVFGIVQQSGGQISVESSLGRGATFHVWLPYSVQAAAAAATPVVVPAVELGGGETVLVVEDDARMRGLVNTILRSAGYKVLEAQSGGDALLIVEQHSDSVDLVLTDVAMPLMSGDQLVERLAKSWPALRAVFMSGNPDMGAQGGRRLGSAPFLQKPFQPEALLRVVRTALAGRAPEQPIAASTLAARVPAHAASPEPAQPGLPLSGLLGPLPAGLLEELHAAVVQARPKLIEQIAAQIATHSGPAAVEIRRLAAEFRYDSIASELALARGRAGL
ncbi:MAG: PAS domain S-box protein [Polyangiaceae bacterium]